MSNVLPESLGMPTKVTRPIKTKGKTATRVGATYALPKKQGRLDLL